jgi:hypothetical protein
VAAGQALVLLGNTGNSSAPQLDFGLLDDPDPLVGESLPMAFDRWTLEGTVRPEAFIDELGAASLAPAGTREEQTARRHATTCLTPVCSRSWQGLCRLGRRR